MSQAIIESSLSSSKHIVLTSAEKMDKPGGYGHDLGSQRTSFAS